MTTRTVMTTQIAMMTIAAQAVMMAVVTVVGAAVTAVTIMINKNSARRPLAEFYIAMDYCLICYRSSLKLLNFL